MLQYVIEKKNAVESNKVMVNVKYSEHFLGGDKENLFKIENT